MYGEILDNEGRLLGHVVVAFGGRLILYDSVDTLRGEYDPRANETRRADGTLVAEGNLLISLLNPVGRTQGPELNCI